MSAAAAATSFEKPSSKGELVLDQAAATQWMSNYPDAAQSALQELVTRIRGISFDTFSKALSTSLLNIPKFKGTPAVLVAKNKSNEWVADVAKVRFGFKGSYYPLGQANASDFVQTLTGLNPNKWPAEIVLFDDASYSGKQMSDHVQAIVDIMTDKIVRPTKISVVVPFMTSTALAKLQAIKMPKGIQLAIAPYQQILTVRESMSAANYQTLVDTFPDFLSADADNGVTVTYFAHKIPNSQSFLTPVAHTEPRILPHIRPPYGQGDNKSAAAAKK